MLEGSATTAGFTPASRLAGDGATENAIRPDIAAAGGKLHVVWLRDQAGKRTAMYAGVTGATITKAVELPFVATAPYSLRVAAAGDTVYAVAVQDMGAEGRSRLPLVRSTDGGKTWYALPATFTGRGDWARWNPAIAAAGDHVYIAWTDRRDGASDIYLAASHDKGGTWTTRRLDEPNADPEIAADSTDVRNNQALASVAVDETGRQVFVTWADFRGYAWDLYGTQSTDSAVHFTAGARMDRTARIIADEELERIYGVSSTAVDAGCAVEVSESVTDRKAVHMVGNPVESDPIGPPDPCLQSLPPYSPGYRPHIGNHPTGLLFVWQAATKQGNDIGASFSMHNTWSERAIITAPGEQFNPRTAGGAVVWEDWRSGHGQIGLARLQ
jgi:beta propeller repeat protein